MKTKQLLVVGFLLIFSTTYSQIKVSPYISSGYMNHLQRKGINTEIGINVNPIKWIDIAVSVRYSPLYLNENLGVKIQAANSFLSIVVLNRGNHKLMLGPGISYGKYWRSSPEGVFEKEYTDWWFNLLKVRYDYSVNEKMSIGLDASIYGEDGDPSSYLGLTVSYHL